MRHFLALMRVGLCVASASAQGSKPDPRDARQAPEPADRPAARTDENSRLANGRTVRFLNVNHRLAGPDRRLFEGMMGDRLHPSENGYQVWADGLKPILTEWLGPPAATDHAPPPTGDPSARTRSRLSTPAPPSDR